MKLLLALFFCGYSCVLGSPTCDESEVNKCHVPGLAENHLYPETSAELVSFCRDALKELDCQIAFTERCPNTLTGAFREVVKKYRVAYGNLCDEPLRQKFLEKGSCLNEEESRTEIKCQEKVEKQDYCKRYDLVLECARDEISRKCGHDGEEIYAEIYEPKKEMKNVFCP